MDIMWKKEQICGGKNKQTKTPTHFKMHPLGCN